MACIYTMRQGEQYALVMRIEVNGNPIDLLNVEKIEFAIDAVSKTYPGEVTYNKELDEFYFPVTVEESSGWSGYVDYQVRVTYVNENKLISPVQQLDVENSMFKNIP